MRTGFSTKMLQYMYGSNTSNVLATLIQIHHPLLTSDLYYINKSLPIANGNGVNPSTLALVPGTTFLPRAFKCPLPSEMTATLPTLTLTIDNSDLQPGYALLPTANGIKPDVFLSCVMLSDPTTNQFGPCHFICPEISGDSKQLVLTLTYEDALNEMFPVPGQTPYGYPALFGLTIDNILSP